ncbi:MAG: response regulator [Candidatus Micrarchaeia archaeon]
MEKKPIGSRCADAVRLASGPSGTNARPLPDIVKSAKELLEGPHGCGGSGVTPGGVQDTRGMSSSNGPLTSTRNLRVLVVDDEEIITGMLGIFLKKMGYSPTVCNDPLQALEIFRQGNFDVVLTDQTMPGMIGLDMIREMKERAPNIIYILMSGYAIGNTDGATKQVGAFMNKPISLHVLYRTIEDLCKRRETNGTSLPSP